MLENIIKNALNGALIEAEENAFPINHKGKGRNKKPRKFTQILRIKRNAKKLRNKKR